MDTEILPIPENCLDEDIGEALQPSVYAQPVPRAIGRRHENASVNARMLKAPEDSFTRAALAAAREHYESGEVTISLYFVRHPCMVLFFSCRSEAVQQTLQCSALARSMPKISL